MVPFRALLFPSIVLPLKTEQLAARVVHGEVAIQNPLLKRPVGRANSKRNINIIRRQLEGRSSMEEITNEEGINGTVWSMEVTTMSTLQEAEEETIATVIIIVLAATLVIAILFILGIFIDCRQEKVHKSRLQKSKNVLKSIIPQLTRRDDEVGIVSAMQEGNSSDLRV